MKDLNHNLKLLVLAIAIAIVAVWRGIWGLMDIYLFPENQPLSFLVSLIIGLIILYFHDHKLKDLV